MTRSRILLVAILIGIAAYWYYDHNKRQEEIVQRAEAAAAIMKRAAVENLLAPKPLSELINNRADAAAALLPAGFHPVASEWDAAEKKRFDALLPANAFDVLVVPFQVQDNALGRSSRSLMSALLAQAIRTSGARVPDTYLVLRALGENERRFDPEAVYSLARRLGVKRTIWSFTGHDRGNKMSYLIRVQDGPQQIMVPPGQLKGDQGHPALGFSDEAPPIVAFQAVLPDIMRNLGYTLPASATQPSRFDGSAPPASPRDMVSDSPDPGRDAFSFLAFAALTPASMERARERFAEKAFLASQSLAADYPDARLLKARIFMLMGLRPAALSALGQPANAEEKALLATLNGNLPDVIAETSRIKPPMKRMFAELDLAEMRSKYSAPDSRLVAAKVKAIGLPGSVWPLFASRAVSDGDGWAQFQNLEFKNLLDAEFPIQGFTAEGIVSGAATLADPAAIQSAAEFSVHNHIRQLIEKDPAKICCGLDPAHPSTADYFDLMEAIGFDNLSRQIFLVSYFQGRPDVALGLAARFDVVYKGHPHLSILRAKAEAAAARKADNTVREGLTKSAYVDAINTLYWERGQTRDAAEAFGELITLGRSDYGYLMNPYVGDHPYRSYYSTWEASSVELELRNLGAALANSTFDTGPVLRTYDLLVGLQHKDAEFSEMLKTISGRFAGNTGLMLLEAKDDLRHDNIKAAEAKYREAIRLQPATWGPYDELADMLLHEGRAAESAKIVLSYPGFRPGSTENRVSLSSYAYVAGSHYYWSGHFDLAKPLYKIAANLQTGSEGEMTSDLRLKLLAGDYAGALMGTYVRATRYNAPYAYRDYLSFLHAMRLSKEAWDGFNALVNQQQHPSIWESALVGHRMNGTSEQEIFAWAKQDSLRNAGADSSFAAMYMLRAAVTDRVPGESTAASIAEVDRKVWKVDNGHGLIVRAAADGQVQYVLGPESSDGSTLPLGMFDRVPKAPVKSQLVYFAEAYRLLRTGKYDDARILLEEAAAMYDLSMTNQSFMLPYLAFAAAQSGNLTGVDKTLAAFRTEQRGFDYLLAQAVIAGLSGKTDDSIKLLQKARYYRPFTEMRPIFTEYQYGEIIEWLFEATGKTAYRDLALRWVKICEQSQPWHAWAYAMEAKLGRDSNERRRAIAMARYLDRDSERLKSVPKRQIDEAVSEFGRSNPFLKMKDDLKEHPA